jgi:hypothetical protein
MIAGKKQQNTTNAAAIHLNIIFKPTPTGYRNPQPRPVVTRTPAVVLEGLDGL